MDDLQHLHAVEEKLEKLREARRLLQQLVETARPASFSLSRFRQALDEARKFLEM